LRQRRQAQREHLDLSLQTEARALRLLAAEGGGTEVVARSPNV